MTENLTGAMPVSLTRAQVLSHRMRVQGLPPDPEPGPGPLDTGVLDTPPGSAAHLAARVRPPQSGPTVLVHSVRGTMHVHLTADLPLLAAGLRPGEAGDLARATHGPFFEEVRSQGITIGAAIDEVAAAMGTVLSDGRPRTKGQLSTELQPLVDSRLRPWCPGCAAAHVHDSLFRMATLPARLTLIPDGHGGAVFQPPAGRGPDDGGDLDRAHHELVRRFLHRCGPSRPAVLAAWLGWTPAAARRSWDRMGDSLVEVNVDGHKAFVLAGDLPALLRAEPADPGQVLLLGPNDPMTEVADRELLVTDPARRREVWRPTANPGIVLAGAEIVGVWRQRRERARLSLRVTTFAPLGRPSTARLRAEAEAVAELTGMTVSLSIDGEVTK